MTNPTPSLYLRPYPRESYPLTQVADRTTIEMVCDADYCSLPEAVGLRKYFVITYPRQS